MLQCRYDNSDKTVLLPAILLTGALFLMVLLGYDFLAIEQGNGGPGNCGIEWLTPEFCGAAHQARSFLRHKPGRTSPLIPGTGRPGRISDAAEIFESLLFFRIPEPQPAMVECSVVLPYYIQKKTLEVRAGPCC